MIEEKRKKQDQILIDIEFIASYYPSYLPTFIILGTAVYVVKFPLFRDISKLGFRRVKICPVKYY